MTTPMIVLAGGFGTRLRSVVKDVPKPMAPIDGTPFLALQLKNWIAQGQQKFIFSLHHQSEVIIDFLRCERGGLLRDVDVSWAVEPKPLGTGGAVAFVGQQLQLDGDVLIGNADTWLGSGLSEVAQASAPAMGVISVPDVTRFGSVEFDKSHLVTRFCEKDQVQVSQQEGCINGGLYKLPIQAFYNVARPAFSVEIDVLPPLVSAGKLRAVPVSGPFFDIGIPDDYTAFTIWYKHTRLGL